MYSTIVFRMKAGEYVVTMVRLSRKLDEEGGQQVVASLLIGISEVEIKIRDGRLSRVAQSLDIFYYPRATYDVSPTKHKNREKDEPEYTLS
jgi:hypothetical protein